MADYNGEPPSPTSDEFFYRRNPREGQSPERGAARAVDEEMRNRGYSREQRAIINQQVYDATENPDLSSRERRFAQRNWKALAGENMFNLWFDWNRWREEIGGVTP